MGKSKNKQRESGRSTNNYKYKNNMDDLPLDITPDKFLSERTIELKPYNEKQRKYINFIKDKNLTIATGYAGCVDKDTEFLSQDGWKKISEYSENDLVTQVIAGPHLKLVKPLSYIKLPCESFNYFKNDFIDQKLSDEHNILDTSFIRHSVYTFLSNKSSLDIYTSFRTDLLEFEDIYIELVCWLLGTKQKDSYVFNKEKIIHLSDFRPLLTYNNISYEDTEDQLIVYHTNYFDFSKPVFDIDVGQHDFDLLFLLRDKLTYTEDGNFTLHDLDKDKIDTIQYILSSSGKTAVVKENSIVVTDNSTTTISYDICEHYKSLDGFKYCFEVESGSLLLRSNGHIFVTGNSSKTYCPTMIAAQMLRDKQIDRIILIRSPVSDEESVGMLKGDLIEKTKYWLMPILDTLNKALTPNLVDLLIKREQILCLAPEFLKGVSFTERDFVIFDEAEDMSKSVALATVTRQGGGKMVLCGDLRQSMISRESGLPLLLGVIEKTPKLQEKVGVIDFNDYEDIVRSEDCKDWVKAFCKNNLM